jgi:hypothetical protein
MKHVKRLTAEDGKIFGKNTTLTMVNPYTTYFIAHYPGGRIIKGNNLFETGWDELPDGITKLEYRLSTGHIVKIPPFRAYLHLVEVSESIDGGRVFHSVNIKGMTDKNSMVNVKIILKKDQRSKFNIGDVVVSEDKEKPYLTTSWKMAAV